MKSKLILIFIFPGLVFFFVTNCSIKENKAEKLNDLLTQCYNKGVFNGNALVAEGEVIIFNKSFGYSDFENGVLLQTNSPFYLASVSKQFTTMAIMILKERNKLNYENKLSDYFPEFPPYADQVSVRHLMTHTSGIPDHFRLGLYKVDLTNDEVFETLIKQDSLEFSPGDKYLYSNGGYILLAMIVERVSGLSFHEFLKQNIFGPLNMDHTLVYDSSKPEIPQRAIGYNMAGEKDDYNILTTGAGGIFSTTEDLFKWDRSLYAEQLIKSETLNEAFESYKLNNDSLTNYGFGWFIKEDELEKKVSHGGALAGYRTYFERQLKKKNTIILLTNKGSSTNIDKITDAINHILKNEPFQIP